MSVISEIVEALEDKGYSIFESLNLLDEFDKEDLEDYAIQNMICPRCGSQLDLNTWEEDRGEFQGKQSSEEMSELICGFCGKIY